MPNPENLRPPWKPGESGNPAGYSRARRLSDALYRLMHSDAEDDAFMHVGYQAAMAGDFNFWKYLYERRDGKIPEPKDEPVLDVKSVARRMQERQLKRGKPKPDAGPGEPGGTT